MTMGQTREMRWIRSFLVAALTACSAGVAHIGGGGHRAPVWLLVALATLGTPAMHALSGRRWTFGHLAAVMGLTQIALHAAMTMSMASSESSGISGHAAHGAQLLHTHGSSMSSLSVGMMLMHVGMTLALAGLLAHGERLLDWTIRRVLRLTRHAVPLIARPVPLPAGHLRRLASALPRAPCGSRAPPVAFVLSH